MKSYFLLALNGFLPISAGNSDLQENIKNQHITKESTMAPGVFAMTSGFPPVNHNTKSPELVTQLIVSVAPPSQVPATRSVTPPSGVISTPIISNSAIPKTSSMDNPTAVLTEQIHPISRNERTLLSASSIPEFKPPENAPTTLLKLESAEPIRKVNELIRLKGIPIFDGTEYGESREHIVDDSHTRTKHFLRQTDHSIGKERSQATLNVDETPLTTLGDSSEFEDYMSHFGDQFYRLGSWIHQGVSDIYEYLTNSVFNPAIIEADTWAQETRAGFAGYVERLSSVIDKESESVGKKLFEAADAYSHRFFNLVHVKESDHPALAAKMTRIVLAICLSLTLVFIIFAIALHLQRTLVAKAHEEAAKQVPVADQQVAEQLFFAMPPIRPVGSQ
jgi:hypothetical protein